MKRLVIIIASILGLSTAFPISAQWEQTSGPKGAGIRFLVNNDSVIFASTSNNGLFRSTDNGENWGAVNVAGSGTPDAMAVRNSIAVASIAGGVYGSTDCGATWFEASATAVSSEKNFYLQELCAGGSFFFALTPDSGVYRSSDNGDTWTRSNNGFDSLYALNDLEASGSLLFCAAIKHRAGGLKHAVYRSTDFGNHWTASDSGFPDPIAVYRLTTGDSGIIAVTNSSAIYRSDDQGRYWYAVSAGSIRKDSTANPDVAFAADLSFAWKGALLAAGRINYPSSYLAISTDNGANWNPASPGLPPNSLACLTIHDTAIFVGTETAGIFRSSDNGAHWAAVNTGIIGTEITGLVQYDGAVFSATWGGGIFRSPDNGTTWSPVITGLPDLRIASLAVKDSFMFAGGSTGIVFRSPAPVVQWTATGSGVPGAAVSGLTAFNGMLFASTVTHGLYASTDNGDRWVPAGAGLSDNDCQCMAPFGATLFAGDTGGLFSYDTETNQWENVTTFPGNNAILCIAGYGAMLFAGTRYNGLYSSNDSGRTWDRTTLPYIGAPRTMLTAAPPYCSDGCSERTTYPILSLTAHGSTVCAYVGGWHPGSAIGGVWYSVDSGRTWKSINPDSPVDFNVKPFVIKNDTILTGTLKNGVWRLPIPGVSATSNCSSDFKVVPGADFIIRSPTRTHAFPSVDFTLPRPEKTIITVHTPGGKRVAVLVDGELGAGFHRIVWNCSGAAPGLYIVNISSGKNRLSRTVPVMQR